MCNVSFYLHRCHQSGEEGGEPKFNPSGYDKDLVANLERDIVQRNPKVYWSVF